VAVTSDNPETQLAVKSSDCSVTELNVDFLPGLGVSPSSGRASKMGPSMNAPNCLARSGLRPDTKYGLSSVAYIARLFYHYYDESSGRLAHRRHGVIRQSWLKFLLYETMQDDHFCDPIC